MILIVINLISNFFEYYHKTAYWKAKKKRRVGLIAEKKKIEDTYIEYYTKNRELCKIYNGPFRDMKYITNSCGSALLPKLIGTYEEPIQDWISEIIDKKYKHIVDIGCAEGYYAVGIALKLPSSTVLAYDIDEVARISTNELKILNKVENVSIGSECTKGDLNNFPKFSTLIICDIEGNELDLLDPVLVPNLMYYDLIIETHDFYNKLISKTLIDRFKNSHIIERRVDKNLRSRNHKIDIALSNKEYNVFVDEKRPKNMVFLYLKSLNRNQIN